MRHQSSGWVFRNSLASPAPEIAGDFQQIVQVLKAEGTPAVFVCRGLSGPLAIYTPQIADGDHFNVMTRPEPSDNRRKFATAIAGTHMTEVDPLIRPGDSRVGYRRCPQERRSGHEQ